MISFYFKTFFIFLLVFMPSFAFAEFLTPLPQPPFLPAEVGFTEVTLVPRLKSTPYWSNHTCKSPREVYYAIYHDQISINLSQTSEGKRLPYNFTTTPPFAMDLWVFNCDNDNQWTNRTYQDIMHRGSNQYTSVPLYVDEPAINIGQYTSSVDVTVGGNLYISTNYSPTPPPENVAEGVVIVSPSITSDYPFWRAPNGDYVFTLKINPGDNYTINTYDYPTNVDRSNDTNGTIIDTKTLDFQGGDYAFYNVLITVNNDNHYLRVEIEGTETRNFFFGVLHDSNAIPPQPTSDGTDQIDTCSNFWQCLTIDLFTPSLEVGERFQTIIDTYLTRFPFGFIGLFVDMYNDLAPDSSVVHQFTIPAFNPQGVNEPVSLFTSTQVNDIIVDNNPFPIPLKTFFIFLWYYTALYSIYWRIVNRNESS